MRWSWKSGCTTRLRTSAIRFGIDLEGATSDDAVAEEVATMNEEIPGGSSAQAAGDRVSSSARMDGISPGLACGTIRTRGSSCGSPNTLFANNKCGYIRCASRPTAGLVRGRRDAVAGRIARRRNLSAGPPEGDLHEPHLAWSPLADLQGLSIQRQFDVTARFSQHQHSAKSRKTRLPWYRLALPGTLSMSFCPSTHADIS